MALNFKKILSFTLAETLVVMGIIGIVSSLTLPNLNASTGEKEKIAKVKKFNSEMNDALGRAEITYGPISTWYGDLSSSDVAGRNNRFLDRLSDYLKITRICKSSGSKVSGCMATETMGSLRYGKITDNYGSFSQVILADGTAVAIWIWSEEGYGNFYIDIDGPNKGTSVAGKDLFVFLIDPDDGIIPYGLDGDDYKKCFSYGNTCAAWVVQNDNMDYLKTDKNGLCPNNTTLSWTNISCN